MSLKRHLAISFILVSFLLLFQNCKIQTKTFDGGSTGTTVGNPFQFQATKLKFESYTSQLQNVDMCLTNVLFRFDEYNSDLVYNNGNISIPMENTDFSTAYFYYDSTEKKYYINGVLSKIIKLNSDGTLIGQFNIPTAIYDRIIFGFTKCYESENAYPSITVTNSNGTFSDDPNKFFALAYDGHRNLHGSENSFVIDYFTDSLVNISSDDDIQNSLNSYRSFELLGFTSTQLAGFNQVKLFELANQSTGKTIAIGGSAGISWAIGRVTVARYNSDGLLDSSFGNQESLPGVFMESTREFDIRGMGGAVGPDDSIYVVTNTEGIGVLKITPDGQIDNSWGTNGWVYVSGGALSEYGHDVYIGNDGSVFVIGVNDDYNFVISKLQPSGAYDTSFGSNGIVLIPTIVYNYHDKISLSLQSDGKILFSATFNAPVGADWLMGRLNSDGTMDTSFGTNGIRNINFGLFTYSFAMDHIQLNDGKIIIVGNSNEEGDTTLYNEGSKDFAIMRLNTYGTTDASFGINGWTRYNFGGNDTATGVVLDDSNQILVSGNSQISNIFSFVFLALDQNGLVAEDSKRTFTLNPGAVGRDMIIRPDGNLYLGGSDFTSFNLLTVGSK